MITIEKVEIKDLKDLQKIAKITFYDTFHAHNSEDNMNKYLEMSFSDDKLKNEILNPESIFYLLKENENNENNKNVIGYLKLNLGDAQTELKDHRGLEIERIYLLKEYHGKKLANLLMNKAIEVAKEKNKSFIWLGVEDKNLKAIKFYQKNGFNEFDKHIFKFGDEMQTDIMMKLIL